MLNVLVVILIAAAFLVPAFLFSGWITMLCLGALAHIFHVPELAIAYWPSVLVSVILGTLFGGVVRD